MKAYKGFNKDLTCRGFQYEVGKTYETDKADLCNSGFHACLDPLDCFSYYSPATSVYHEVEIEDNGQRSDEDSKVVGKKITIGKELSVKQICDIHAAYVAEGCTSKKAGEDYAELSGGKYSSLSGGRYSSLSGLDGSSLSGLDGSVVSCFNGKCKAGLGSVITIANRRFENGKYTIYDFATGIVDGEKIKADTWYKCENNELVEVEDDGHA